MLSSDLQPPQAGPGSDPVLYGVAAGLADLFPPVVDGLRSWPDPEPADEDASQRD